MKKFIFIVSLFTMLIFAAQVSAADLTENCVWDNKYNDSQHWQECTKHRSAGTFNGIVHGADGKRDIANHTLAKSGTPSCDYLMPPQNIWCTSPNCGYESTYKEPHVKEPIQAFPSDFIHIWECANCDGWADQAPCTDSSGNRIDCSNRGLCTVCNYDYRNEDFHAYVYDYNANGTGTCHLCGHIGFTNLSFNVVSYTDLKSRVIVSGTLTGGYDTAYGVRVNINSAKGGVTVNKLSESYSGDNFSVTFEYNNVIGNTFSSPCIVWIQVGWGEWYCEISITGPPSSQVVGKRTPPVINSAVVSPIDSTWRAQRTVTVNITDTFQTPVEVGLFKTDGTVASAYGSATRSGSTYQRVLTPITEAGPAGVDYVVRARDSFGNIREYPLKLYYIDSLAPNSITVSGLEASVWRPSKVMRISCKDGGYGNVQMAISDQPSVYKTSTYDAGTGTWYCDFPITGQINSASKIFYVKDGLSNGTTTAFTIQLVDSQPVGTPSYNDGSTPQRNGWYLQDIPLKLLHGSTGISGVNFTEHSLDGGATWSTSLSRLLTNTATVLSRTKNNAGVLSTTPKTQQFKIDKSSPQYQTGFSTESWTNQPITVQVVARDPESGIETYKHDPRLSSDPPITGIGNSVSTQIYTVNANGTYTAKVTDYAGRTTDAKFTVGNIDMAPVSPPVYKDNGTPKHNGWYAGNVPITIQHGTTGPSGVDYTEYSTDGGATWSTGLSKTVSETTTIQSRTKNKAGTYSPVTTQEFKVDKNPPKYTATISTTDWTNQPVSVQIATRDDESGINTYTHDSSLSSDGPVTGVGNDLLTKTYSVSSNGQYSSVSVDYAGNTTDCNFEITNIDMASVDPPTYVDNDTPQRNGWYLEDVPVDITHGKALGPSGVDFTEHSIDGGVTWSREMSHLLTERLTIQGRTKNNAGTYSLLATQEFKVDKNPPEYSVTRSTAAWTNQPVSVSVEVKDLESGLETYSFLTTDPIHDAGNAIIKKTYTIINNGSYIPLAVDYAGYETDCLFEIANIDYTPPQMTKFELISAERRGLGFLFKQGLYFDVDGIDTPNDENGESGIATFNYQVFNLDGTPVTPVRTSEWGESIKPVEFEFNGYVTAWLIDNAGNDSRDNVDDGTNKLYVFSDDSPPTITHALDNTEFTNQSVTITFNGFSEKAGFSHFYFPEAGETVYGDVSTKIVEKNRSVSVYGYTHAGIYAEHVVDVTNIDLTPPIIETLSLKRVNNGIEVSIRCSDTPRPGDAQSGVDTFNWTLYDDKGRFISEGSSPIDSIPILPDFNGELACYVTDRAGNNSPDGTRVKVDNGIPIVTYERSTEEFTKDPVDLQLMGRTMGVTKFTSFFFPATQETVKSTRTTVTCEENQTVEVEGADSIGNTVSTDIVVDNIDLTPPQILSLSFEKVPGTDQAKMSLDTTDTPIGIDAESGVRTLSYTLYDEEGTKVQAESNIPLNKVDSIEPLTTPFVGTLRAYVTDGVDLSSDQSRNGDGTVTETPDLRGEEFEVVIDDNPPRIYYHIKDKGPGYVTVAIYGEDDESGFSHFTINGATYYGSPVEYTFTGTGSITVTGYDKSGNSATATISVVVEPDSGAKEWPKPAKPDFPGFPNSQSSKPEKTDKRPTQSGENGYVSGTAARTRNRAFYSSLPLASRIYPRENPATLIADANFQQPASGDKINPHTGK